MSEDVVKNPDTESEERYLKLQVQGHSQIFEVPLESNGSLSLSDLHMILPNAMALIIDYYSVTRLLKPKNGYFNQPKERWESVLVSVVLNAQITNSKSTPLPSIGDETSVFDLHESSQHTTSTPLQEEHPFIKTEIIETDANVPSPVATLQETCKLPPSTLSSSSKQEISPVLTPDIRNVALPPSFTTVENDVPEENNDKEEGELEDDEIMPPHRNHPGLNHGIIAEPSIKVILDAYNVVRINDLKEMLCRGNPFYHTSFDFVTTHLRKTLLVYPTVHCNNEIVRLLHYAMKSNLLFKQINPDSDEVCELCGGQLTLSHLLSKNHVKLHKAAYSEEPPEILSILEPSNNSFYVNPITLSNLKIDDFKQMEKLPEFCTVKCIQFKKHIFMIKYRLIHRILEANLKISNKESFSVDKIFFLRERCNNPILWEIFTNLSPPFNCLGCGKFPKNLFDCLKHILSVEHLGSHLTQNHLDMICLAFSFVKEYEKGYMFLPKKYIFSCMRKRRGILESSEIAAKRQKLG